MLHFWRFLEFLEAVCCFWLLLSFHSLLEGCSSAGLQDIQVYQETGALDHLHFSILLFALWSLLLFSPLLSSPRLLLHMLPCYSPLFRIVLVIFVFLTSALFLYIFLCPLSFLSSFLSGFLNLLFSFRNPLSEHLPFTRFLDVLKPYENQLNIARASVLFLVSFLWKCSSPSPSPLSRCLSLSSSRVFNSSNSTVSSCVLIWQNLAGDDPPSVRPQWFHVTSKNQSNSLSAQTVSMNRLYFDDPLSVLPACPSICLPSFVPPFLSCCYSFCLSVCLSSVCLSIYLPTSFPPFLPCC